MRTAFTATAEVDAPPERVWSTLVDWDRAPAWMAGVDVLRADGPVAPGTTLTFSGAGGDDRAASLVEVDADRLLVLRSTHGGVVAEYRYELVPLVGGTRVELTASWAPEGLLGRAVGRVAADAMRRTDSDQPAALCAVVAAGSSDDGDATAADTSDAGDADGTDVRA